MDFEKLVKDFKKRLMREAFFKSLLFASIVAFSALAIYFAIDWYFGLKLIYVGALIFFAVLSIATLILFIKFKPSGKDIARRIDKLGLKERCITMRELAGQDTHMARRQRRDTAKAIKELDASVLKFAVTTSLIVVLSIVGTLGLGATATATFSVVSGQELVNNYVVDPPKVFTITYEWEGEDAKGNPGGYVEGETTQLVKEGESASAVTAVAYYGFEFVGWSDGFADPTRQDTEVNGTKVFVAIFITSESFDGKDDDVYNGRSPSEGEKTKGEGNPDPDNSLPGDQEDGLSEGGGNGGNEGGGSSRSDSRNQIIDGATYYGDQYSDALNDANEEINSNGDYSDAEKGVADGYFNNLRP